MTGSDSPTDPMKAMSDQPTAQRTEERTMSDPKVTPAGDRRERSVPCVHCRRETWNIDRVCDACRPSDLATPEELADMFGVTDPAEISDDLYADYESWMMSGPDVFAPWEEDIDESMEDS